jgi:hypothetical protein
MLVSGKAAHKRDTETDRATAEIEKEKWENEREGGEVFNHPLLFVSKIPSFIV